MPKKNEDWDQVSKPTTPSQVNNYFELCSKWFLEHHEQEKRILKHLNIYSLPHKIEYNEHFLEPSQINHNYVSKCFFCNTTTNIQVINCNPFTRKCVMFLCKQCFLESD